MSRADLRLRNIFRADLLGDDEARADCERTGDGEGEADVLIFEHVAAVFWGMLKSGIQSGRAPPGGTGEAPDKRGEA